MATLANLSSSYQRGVSRRNEEERKKAAANPVGRIIRAAIEAGTAYVASGGNPAAAVIGGSRGLSSEGSGDSLTDLGSGVASGYTTGAGLAKTAEEAAAEAAKKETEEIIEMMGKDFMPVDPEFVREQSAEQFMGPPQQIRANIPQPPKRYGIDQANLLPPPPTAKTPLPTQDFLPPQRFEKPKMLPLPEGTTTLPSKVGGTRYWEKKPEEISPKEQANIDIKRGELERKTTRDSELFNIKERTKKDPIAAQALKLAADTVNDDYTLSELSPEEKVDKIISLTKEIELQLKGEAKSKSPSKYEDVLD